MAKFYIVYKVFQPYLIMYDIKKSSPIAATSLTKLRFVTVLCRLEEKVPRHVVRGHVIKMTAEHFSVVLILYCMCKC